jgi:hypothetical protein
VSLVERLGGEVGLQSLPVSQARLVVGESSHQFLALGVVAVVLEDDHKFDCVVEALDGLFRGVRGERAVDGCGDLGLLEGRGEGLLHLGPGVGERCGTSCVACASLVLSQDVKS